MKKSTAELSVFIVSCLRPGGFLSVNVAHIWSELQKGFFRMGTEHPT